MSGFDSDLEIFIDNFGFLWTEYILGRCRQPGILKLIETIQSGSGKSAGEALLAFFSAIRYICDSGDALANLEKEDSFPCFVNENSDEIIRLAAQNKVQGNFIERAFPVLDALGELKTQKPVFVIELGASLGLIGKGLLFPERVISLGSRLFAEGQQLPVFRTPAGRYCGIELQIPDRKWFLACIHDPQNVERLSRQLDIFNGDPAFSLISGDAFSFEDLAAGERSGEYEFMILTSFMMYQLDSAARSALRAKIEQFCKKYGGHWINQSVVLTEKKEYYVEIDGRRVIRINDDLCFSWKFL